MFIAHLSKEGIAHTTNKVYLAAICHLHVSVGMIQTYNQQLSPYLDLVMKGIKKEQLHGKPQRQCLPITFSIMASIHTVLACTPNDYHSIMMWAACCMAFFGFLRCSEFTVASLQEFDPEVHLTIKDIAIDKKVEPSVVRVTIKQSKTDPFWQGINLFLGVTEHAVCPVKTILPYLVLRENKDGPLFISAKGIPLTRQYFSKALSIILKHIGLDDWQYNTHSFRIRAASSAKAPGVSDTHINILGRWQSSVYQLYIRTPREQLATSSRQLIST